jgi:hypothetical protein
LDEQAKGPHRLCKEGSEAHNRRWTRDRVYSRTVITHKGATNQVKLNQLEAEQNHDVWVVDVYPNVFLEELPGMLPDRDIEFVIELVPRTAPIYKSPYRMPDKQLAELKEQIQELQGKGYI